MGANNLNQILSNLLGINVGILTPTWAGTPNPGDVIFNTPRNQVPTGIPQTAGQQGAAQQQVKAGILGRLGQAFSNPALIQSLAGLALSQGKYGGARGGAYLQQGNYNQAMADESERTRQNQNLAIAKILADIQSQQANQGIAQKNLDIAASREQREANMDQSQKALIDAQIAKLQSPDVDIKDVGDAIVYTDTETGQEIARISKAIALGEGQRLVKDRQVIAEGAPKEESETWQPFNMVDVKSPGGYKTIQRSNKGKFRDPKTGQLIEGMDIQEWHKPEKPSDLSQMQTNQIFLRISDKYQADPIIKQVVTGRTAYNLAQQVIDNPEQATNQLAAMYMYVKNLDPDSAVREGELSLAKETTSYIERFKTSFAKILEGQPLGSKAGKELAVATQKLMRLWAKTAEERTKQYKAQARVSGVGDAFDQYLGAFESDYSKAFSEKSEEPEIKILSVEPKK